MYPAEYGLFSRKKHFSSPADKEEEEEEMMTIDQRPAVDLYDPRVIRALDREEYDAIWGFEQEVGDGDGFLDCDEYEMAATIPRHEWMARGAAFLPDLLRHQLDKECPVDHGRAARAAARHAKLSTAFRDALTAHITTTAGTDLLLDLHTSIVSSEAGDTSFSIALAKDTAEGTLVADASIEGMCLYDQRITFDIDTGAFGALSMQTQDFYVVTGLFSKLMASEESDIVTSFGIGLDDSAFLSGGISEDRSVAQTAFITFGSMEVVFFAPTIDLIQPDGTKRHLMEQGRFVEENFWQ